MNITEWDNLTLEQRKIAVAELCGWVKKSHTQYGTGKPLWGRGERCKIAENLPDYLGSLDVIREAETLLPADKLVYYIGFLEGFCSPNHFLLATAEQRAKAFVIVMTN